jgi:cyclopropane fatty-acyl-phospholipid synthase-like methyltransferase
MFADLVLPKLPTLQARLEAGARILDVGCGAGYAVVELAERFPGVTCVGLDVEPTSISLAQTLILSHGLEDRVEARLVDGATLPEDLTGAFDLVTTFVVLHEIWPPNKETVVAACARALKPGGIFLAFDERYADGPAELRDPTQILAVMAQWYEAHWGNIIDTQAEIKAMLERQGLRITDETGLSRFYIVTAEKG